MRQRRPWPEPFTGCAPSSMATADGPGHGASTSSMERCSALPDCWRPVPRQWTLIFEEHVPGSRRASAQTVGGVSISRRTCAANTLRMQRARSPSRRGPSERCSRRKIPTGGRSNAAPGFSPPCNAMTGLGPNRTWQVCSSTRRCSITSFIADTFRCGRSRCMRRAVRHACRSPSRKSLRPGGPIGIIEIADGHWLLRFLNLDHGVIDRRTRKFHRFGPGRPPRTKAPVTPPDTVSDVTGL